MKAKYAVIGVSCSAFAEPDRPGGGHAARTQQLTAEAKMEVYMAWEREMVEIEDEREHNERAQRRPATEIELYVFSDSGDETEGSEDCYFGCGRLATKIVCVRDQETGRLHRLHLCKFHAGKVAKALRVPQFSQETPTKTRR